MKKIGILTVCTLTLGLISFGENVSAKKVETPGDYVEYLEDKVIGEQIQTFTSHSRVDSNVQEALETFKDLPQNDQEQFLDYINDVDVLEKIWDGFEDLQSQDDITSITMFDGDVEIAEEIELQDGVSRNSLGLLDTFTHEDEATRTARISVQGVDVARTYAYVQWSSQGDASGCCIVTSVNDTDSGIVQNLVPLQELEDSPRQPYISNNNGIFSVAWHIRYDYDGIGVGTSTRVHEVTVIGTGSHVGRVYSLN
ncbi:hypothetical protein [Alteribacter aurantiacus]|uniref:hypothetical protein n=1 Tax=Alteribacter aurantiacus TaxID=254410 RepID=UPI0003FB3BED|nr:hypothetical protein [Alteribacter aurantiacus]